MFQHRHPELWANRTLTVRQARRLIDDLDPEQDCAEITHISLEVMTPPLFSHMAYASGFARGTTHPAEARAVHRGAGYLHAPVNRDRDTMTFFGLLHRYGPHSPELQELADRIQQIHHDVRGVGNQLQLHILGLMMYEPERWARDLGLPDYFTDREHQARYHLWKAIGTRMGIRGIWDSYGEVEPWILAFEEKHGARSSEGVEIYRGQIRGFEKYFPRPLRFLAGPVLTAGLPVSARDHLDAPRVPVLVDKAMRAVATVVRLTEPVRPVNLSSTWVRDFSRMGDDPDISRMGYQHDTSSDPRYAKVAAAGEGHRFTVAEGLQPGRGCPMHGAGM